MKVLVYTSLFPNHLQPNFGIFIKQRMIHWARLENCQLKVVAPVPYCPPWRFLGWRYSYSQTGYREVIDGIEVLHPRFVMIPKVSMPFHGFSLFLCSIKTIKKILSTYAFDLVDGHFIYPDGFAAVLLGRFFQKPVVLSARGSDINQFTKFRTIKPMIRYALRKCNHIIAVCDTLKQEIVKLGVNGRKVSVIQNGVAIDEFYPIDKNYARETLSLPNHSKIILSVGSLIPRKGFDLIIEAMPQLIRHFADIGLYIIGDGPLRRHLQQKIARLKLDPYVKCIGEIPNHELRMWYGAADVFCLASSREGWPNVIMESLACGTPVVATNVWGTPEILTSPTVGILVERTPESIFKGLLNALDKEWDRKKIHNHVAGRAWNKVAKEVDAIFRPLLTNHFIRK
jgi:glycosyltransferase involved in cell wall biosynthesis